MKKFLQKLSDRRGLFGLFALFALPCLLVVSGVYTWANVTLWHVWTIWILSISLIFAFFRYEAYLKEREETWLQQVSLGIDVLSPESQENIYGHYPAIKLINSGKEILSGNIEVYIYPNTKGRQDSRNPRFQNNMKEKLTSFGSVRKIHLRLRAGETKLLPYEVYSILGGIGLHEHVPHWLYFKTNYGPEALGSFQKQEEELFHLHNWPGRKWYIDRMLMKMERCDSQKWKKKAKAVLDEEIPSDFLQENKEKYVELFSRD